VARPRAGRPDVAAGVGLGEHHGAAPLALDHALDEARLLRVGAEAVDDAGDEVAEQVEGRRGVGAGEQLEVRPRDGRRRAEAAVYRLNQVNQYFS
jgi:hypothetical protein